MADILKGTIKLEAPGVQQTTNTVINSMGKMEQSLKKVAPSSNTATQSLINLSRVAQDAPYGFIGIANNLNPLLESFQRLKTETGSSKSALSSLLGALTGPAGIGLALGVVSSLLITFGDRLFSSSKAIDLNALALARFKTEADDAKSALDRMNDSISYSNRIGKLNLEIAFGKGLSTDLEDLRGQSTENLTAINKIVQEREAARQRLSEVTGRLLEELSGTAREVFGNEGASGLNAIAEDLPKKVQATLKVYNDLSKDLDDFSKKEREARQGQNLIYRQILQTKIDIEIDANKKAEEERKKALAKLKEQLEEEAKLRFAMLKAARVGFIGLPEGPFEILPDPNAIGEGNKKFQAFVRDKFSRLKIPVRLNIVPETVVTDVNNILKQVDLVVLESKLSDMATSFQGVLAEAIGEGIGEAIVSGDIKSLFSSIFSVMGSFVQEIGKQLIAASVAMLKVKVALAKLFANPFAGIAVGIGLIALGGIIKNSVGKVKPFAEGGIVYGRTNAVFGEYPNARTNPEVVTPLDKLRNMIGGAGGTQVFIPTLEAGYDKVRLVFARANEKGGRY